MQNTLFAPTQALHSTPLLHHVPAQKSFTELLSLVDEVQETENQSLEDLTVRQKYSSNSGNFASHITQEFKWIKAEMDGLKREVKSLKKAARDPKVMTHHNKIL